MSSEIQLLGSDGKNDVGRPSDNGDSSCFPDCMIHISINLFTVNFQNMFPDVSRLHGSRTSVICLELSVESESIFLFESISSQYCPEFSSFFPIKAYPDLKTILMSQCPMFFFSVGFIPGGCEGLQLRRPCTSGRGPPGLGGGLAAGLLYG